ncbi:MAG: carboxymuconolactone decarboxylase family protein [Planctomycetota bacterium]
MPWIRTFQPDEATGRLAKSYAAALQRAGRVFGIVKSMSLAPAVLDASMGLYQRIMFADEGLARYQRELLAVVVSRTNGCHY